MGISHQFACIPPPPPSPFLLSAPLVHCCCEPARFVQFNKVGVSVKNAETATLCCCRWIHYHLHASDRPNSSAGQREHDAASIWTPETVSHESGCAWVHESLWGLLKIEQLYNECELTIIRHLCPPSKLSRPFHYSARAFFTGGSLNCHFSGVGV